MADIKYIKGNIFNSDCQTLVNTVNCVGFMGKGIALEYKYRYPEMYEAYKKICDKNLLEPGLLHLYDKSQPWILNFPTKIHYKYPSKIEYIEKGLKKFSSVYKEKGINSVAFPHLGCSHGGLKFTQVKPLMEKYLSPLDDLEIEVYEFSLNAKDNLYEKLLSELKEMNFIQYQNVIGLKPQQAILLEKIVKKNKISSMLQLRKVRGLGSKSISKIYDFIQNKELKNDEFVNSRDSQTYLF